MTVEPDFAGQVLESDGTIASTRVPSDGISTAHRKLDGSQLTHS